MSELVFQVPRRLRRGGLANDEQQSVESGVELLSLMASSLGLEDLGNSHVLDMGCGCKFTQAILDRSLPIGHYTGIDVYAELIEYLQTNVADSRFDFHRMNTHNDMYNLDGEPLTGTTKLPVAEGSFDVICLFSVFTHLAPDDYVSMLKMLRQYVKPDGQLFFSVFINELTTGGHGHMDSFGKAIMSADEAVLSKHKESFKKVAEAGIPDFFDLVPTHPLKVAMYSREYALKLLDDTGWKLDSLNDPLEKIQHHMVCSPI
ncbi:MAG: SAM-dependent methyltransferase [Bacteroidia bacterium]|jgi:SAM-dependent methyltransferase